MVEEYRIRLVTLGGGGVGKSSIVKRFLYNTFNERYRPTVEDLFCREFDLNTATLKVDILDTAGDLQFPAMRRLSISTAHAFLLVYSLNSKSSFLIAKQCFEEIREHKSDFQEIPIVIVGNKCDIPEEKREVSNEDVTEWLFCDLPRLRMKALECSAKDNYNVREIFKGFLQLAKLPPPQETPGLRRRSSAHVTVGKSKSSPQRAPTQETEDSSRKSKQRSRSLIRRTSKKSKLRDNARGASTSTDDCVVS